jgi:hypothetical protein
MTYGDVFVQIVHEVTGLTKEYLDSVLLEALTAFPCRVSHDHEVPEHKALAMLATLRRERTSILAWCFQSGLKVPVNNPGSA